MDDFKNITKVQKTNLLVCFYDIANFSSIARSGNDVTELFDLLNGMAKITHEEITGSSGHVVKFIGDSAIIIYPEPRVDEGVNTLLSLQRKLEEYFQTAGFPIKIGFNLHFGEVAIGPYGAEPYTSIEVFGDPVNTAATLSKGQHRGGYVISPQVFRKLNPETRKKFHKHTPPIVYLTN